MEILYPFYYDYTFFFFFFEKQNIKKTDQTRGKPCSLHTSIKRAKSGRSNLFYYWQGSYMVYYLLNIQCTSVLLKSCIHCMSV